VLVGSDEMVPFFRTPDPTLRWNERSYAAGLEGTESGTWGALSTEHILTDAVYGDFDPIPWLDRYLHVPDIGIGRLVETPEEIKLQADLFIASQGKLDPHIEEAMGVIHAAAERAASIVRDLILFAEHRPPRRSRCQVVEQVREVVAFEEARLEAEGIAVRVHIEPVPDIWADHNHLQEVLLHVLQNAQHAMREAHTGGVLSISVKPTATGVRIEVKDDGPGIPPEHLPRIFNPFFTTKQPGDGRGLGLSVAHSIVTEHGGRIWAEKHPEGGAVFIIDLPIGEPEPAREPLRFESRRL